MLNNDLLCAILELVAVEDRPLTKTIFLQNVSVFFVVTKATSHTIRLYLLNPMSCRCSQWRDTIRSMSVLWSETDLDVDRERARVWLERRKDRRLTVFVREYSQSLSSHHLDILKACGRLVCTVGESSFFPTLSFKSDPSSLVIVLDPVFREIESDPWFSGVFRVTLLLSNVWELGHAVLASSASIVSITLECSAVRSVADVDCLRGFCALIDAMPNVGSLTFVDLQSRFADLPSEIALPKAGRKLSELHFTNGSRAAVYTLIQILFWEQQWDKDWCLVIDETPYMIREGKDLARFAPK